MKEEDISGMEGLFSHLSSIFSRFSLDFCFNLFLISFFGSDLIEGLSSVLPLLLVILFCYGNLSTCFSFPFSICS